VLTLSKIQPGSHIRIISTDGKVVSESVSDSDKMTFDVSKWHKGVYVVHVRKGESLTTLKAVIQ
jgi:TusA-related sulfurtransferase